jgi:UDPglucose--hexose-1-phosphate uridylyltransferase
MENRMNFENPHRRFNPLNREWVLVSPHRARRPWLGQVEKPPVEDIPTYDPKCYLCPGNTRAVGVQNPVYTSTFVFDNDFSPLLNPGSDLDASPPSFSSSLFSAETVHGICRVGCFSPRHDLTLPELPLEQVEAVIRMWRDQTLEIGSLDYIQYVQVFENKGAMMGCSNPHPHNQIWATSIIPVEPTKEQASQVKYHREFNSCLLCDYLREEQKAGTRLITLNDHFTALVPFWAVWPFEILLLSQRHIGSLLELTDAEITSLADILHRVTTRYDNLFEVSFPYSMGFHQAPTDGVTHPDWHLHAHFYPPLLRSATVKKFMVGFEMLGMPQRDITPETAAERLRSLSEIHYKEK